jgi:acetate kinase
VYLLRHGVSVDELEQALEHESGLTGLAGTGDVASLEADESDAAHLALAVYSYRIAQAIAAMASALDGLDAIAFTAGVGEHSPRVRADVCARLSFLGVALDDAANEHAAGETAIAAIGSSVAVSVVPAREDVMVARAVRGLP